MEMAWLYWLMSYTNANLKVWLDSSSWNSLWVLVGSVLYRLVSQSCWLLAQEALYPLPSGFLSLDSDSLAGWLIKVSRERVFQEERHCEFMLAMQHNHILIHHLSLRDNCQVPLMERDAVSVSSQQRVFLLPVYHVFYGSLHYKYYQ